MNKLRTIASLMVTLVTIGVVVMLVLAVYPALNGGLSANTNMSFTGPTLDENMNITIESSEPMTITSDLPYDLTHVEVSAYMDMGDGVKLTLVDSGELTIKKGESVSIPLSFKIAPDQSMEASAWTLAYNMGSTTGLNVPVVVHVQGYYYDDRFGGSIDVGMNINLSPTATISMSVADKAQIKGTISGIDAGMMGFVPSSGTASICGSDGVSVLDCKFVKDGASITIDSKTTDGKGIVEALEACALANGGKLVLKTNVSGYGSDTYELNAEDTAALIDAVTVAVEKTLEVPA